MNLNETMCKGSECITRNIRVKVYPEYIPPDPQNNDGKNYFSYTITINNESNDFVKLLSRKWIIINADGDKEIIEGEGVVGYTPELPPGMAFTYTSYCPLNTTWGTMEGFYRMVNMETGNIFEIEIKRFYLALPKK
jgi:ApaG protein